MRFLTRRLLMMVVMAMSTIAVAQASHGYYVYAFAQGGYYYVSGEAWNSVSYPAQTITQVTVSSSLGGYDQVYDGPNPYTNAFAAVDGNADTTDGVCINFLAEFFDGTWWEIEDPIELSYQDHCVEAHPAINSGGVAHLGSDYIAIYGQNLDTGGVSVSIDGSPATVTFSSSGQVNAYQSGLSSSSGSHSAMVTTSVGSDSEPFSVP